MTAPMMTLLKYLRKQGISLDADFLREAVQVMMQMLIELEAAQQIGAERYERSPARTTYRKGYREREWGSGGHSILLLYMVKQWRSRLQTSWSKLSMK